MKLRDHPKIKGKWPCRWNAVNPITSSRKSGLQGEQGELKEVKGPFIHGPSGHLALVIEYQGDEWTAQISLNDKVLLQALFSKLVTASNVGMSLQEVGDIDLD